MWAGRSFAVALPVCPRVRLEKILRTMSPSQITSLEVRLIGRAAVRLKHHPHLPDNVEQRAGQS